MMYRITVRDVHDRILAEREQDEPPNNALFEELLREFRQDCYVDVCRLGQIIEQVADSPSDLGFDEEIEFELVRGEHPELEELEDEDE